MKIKLPDNIDSIVMLTASNWKTELRSNRYHYATRFAKTHPVIFVQPDLSSPEYLYESTEHPNIIILHVFKEFGPQQSQILTRALNEKNIRSPLIWIYHVLFWDFIRNVYCAFSIYHATEAYLSPDMPSKYIEGTLPHKALLRVIDHVDLIVSVSEGVEETIVSACNVQHKSCVITNGCDYEFYAENFIENRGIPAPNKKIAFYQGNIYHKLDFSMLFALAKTMPDWEFHYCGPVVIQDSTWDKIRKLKNVQYLGVISPEEIRSHGQMCTVGIIPFGPQDFLSRRSFPLKAFEYLASGLPVITSTIEALKPFSDVFLFADNIDEFKLAMLKAVELRNDSEHLKKRLEQASKQSYNLKFQNLISRLALESAEKQLKPGHKLNILVLYEPESVVVSTVKAHLDGFEKYSFHRIYYAPATIGSEVEINFNLFDVIIIHYSLRLTSTGIGPHIPSDSITNGLENFPGLKILFIQDEYDRIKISWSWIKRLGIQTIYSSVPEKFWPQVYPKDELGQIELVHTLTGYVPEELEKLAIKPTEFRKLLIAYRGRNLPFWYGDLGQEKEFIGVKMSEIARAKNLPVDIEWTEEKRIYGSDWYTFLSSAKVTLGTESGCNVFDFDGELSASIRDFMSKNPTTTYQTVRQTFLEVHEGKIGMNQISPKIFEAIALRTGLVLFEGTYSNIVQANIHYIPLKKDFSNIEEVLEKIQDDQYLKQMTERAYKDVIESGAYRYISFVKSVDLYLGKKLSKSKGTRFLSGIIDASDPDDLFHLSPEIKTSAMSEALLRDDFKQTRFVARGGKSRLQLILRRYLMKGARRILNMNSIKVIYLQLKKVKGLGAVLVFSKNLISKLQ